MSSDNTDDLESRDIEEAIARSMRSEVTHARAAMTQDLQEQLVLVAAVQETRRSRMDTTFAARTTRSPGAGASKLPEILLCRPLVWGKELTPHVALRPGWSTCAVFLQGYRDALYIRVMGTEDVSRLEIRLLDGQRELARHEARPVLGPPPFALDSLCGGVEHGRIYRLTESVVAGGDYLRVKLAYPGASLALRATLEGSSEAVIELGAIPLQVTASATPTASQPRRLALVALAASYLASDMKTFQRVLLGSRDAFDRYTSSFQGDAPEHAFLLDLRGHGEGAPATWKQPWAPLHRMDALWIAALLAEIRAKYDVDGFRSWGGELCARHLQIGRLLNNIGL